MDHLALAVGIGLVIGLLCSELLGLASAGLVVPGYLALHLTNPVPLTTTLGVAFATFVAVKLVSSFPIVHGRRRTALMILFGYLLGMVVSNRTGILPEDYAAIGFIVPGLIALWMDKQGIPQTLSALFIVSVAVRLSLVLLGVELTIA